MKNSNTINKINMKSKYFNFTLILLMTMVLFMAESCKKEDSKPNDNGNGGGGKNPNGTAPTSTSLSAKIDGKLWSADTSKVMAIFTPGSNSIIVSGENADGSLFTLQIHIWDKIVGSFKTALTAQKNIVGLTYKDTNEDSWTAPAKINNTSNISTGTLNVDYYDGKKIKCSFNFTGGSQLTDKTLEIKEGEISVMSIKE